MILPASPSPCGIPNLTDTHAHLGWHRFDPDRDAVVERAVEAGVGRILTIGTDLESSREALVLADRYEIVHAAVGIHPTDVLDLPEGGGWLDQIAEMAGHPKALAIGEIGLDYFHPAPEGNTEEVYRTRQAEVYRDQLELAESLRLPVIVHQRECYDDLVAQTEPFHGRVRCVFHCWTHDWATAEGLVKKGHLISFTGIVTYKSAHEVHRAAAEAAPGSFMIETDCPFLAPVPHRGKRNEPAYVAHVAERIAELRGATAEEIAAGTTATAEAFFG